MNHTSWLVYLYNLRPPIPERYTYIQLCSPIKLAAFFQSMFELFFFFFLLSEYFCLVPYFLAAGNLVRGVSFKPTEPSQPRSVQVHTPIRLRVLAFPTKKKKKKEKKLCENSASIVALAVYIYSYVSVT